MAIFPTLLETLPYDGPETSTVTMSGCASCGSKTGPFTSASAHLSGDAFYLCKTCVALIAEPHGWTAPGEPSEVDTLRAQAAAAEQAVADSKLAPKTLELAARIIDAELVKQAVLAEAAEAKFTATIAAPKKGKS